MTPSRYLLALFVGMASPVALAQTGTDGCASPSPLAGQGSFAFDSSTATTGSAGQGEALCYIFGSSVVDNDVWFAWTADVTGTASVKSCGSPVDTKLAAYPGGGCPVAGTALACNDDSCGLQSELSFPVSAGTAYSLQVGTFPGSPGGAGQLDIAIAAAPSNDDCTTASILSGSGSFAFDNGGATSGLEGQVEPLCYVFGSSAVERDVWFHWSADASGTAVVRTCGSSVDTKLAAYPSSPCPVNGTAIACNDDGCGFQSTVSFAVQAGQVYALQVGTFPGAPGGAGVLEIEIHPPLTSDDCTAPQTISGQGPFPFDTTIATQGLEGQAEAACYQFGTTGIDHDIWFDWTPDVSGIATISTCGNALDTKLAAYVGGGCPVTSSALTCNDDASACGGVQAELDLSVVAGSTYLLQLGIFPGSAGGPGVLVISIAPPLQPGLPYCSCDGSNAPCNNSGLSGRGCANGSDPEGAQLTGSGVAQVGADTFVLSATGLPPGQPGLYFQGLNQVNGGMGNPFGDGLRCVGGGVTRLGVAASSASGASDTTGLGQPISILGGVAAADSRNYQLWYRDPVGSPCGNLFNLSNGYQVQW